MGGVRSNSPGNQLVHLVLTAGGGGPHLNFSNLHLVHMVSGTKCMNPPDLCVIQSNSVISD